MTRTGVILGLGYAALIAATIVGVVEVRHRTLATLASPQAQHQWEAWRSETRELSTSDGPMKRREAKAPEPPLLILLRDHFATSMVSALAAATLFYWFLAFLIRGSLRTPAVRGSTDSGAAA